MIQILYLTRSLTCLNEYISHPDYVMNILEDMYVGW